MPTEPTEPKGLPSLDSVEVGEIRTDALGREWQKARVAMWVPYGTVAAVKTTPKPKPKRNRK